MKAIFTKIPQYFIKCVQSYVLSVLISAEYVLTYYIHLMGTILQLTDSFLGRLFSFFYFPTCAWWPFWIKQTFRLTREPVSFALNFIFFNTFQTIRIDIKINLHLSCCLFKIFNPSMGLKYAIFGIFNRILLKNFENSPKNI